MLGADRLLDALHSHAQDPVWAEQAADLRAAREAFFVHAHGTQGVGRAFCVRVHGMQGT